MKQFFNDAELAELFANANQDDKQDDHRPVVKLFLPDEPINWLLNKINPNNLNIAYGLTDFGDGEAPHLGWINLVELSGFEGRYGFEVTKDKSFKADQPLSYYFNQARRHAHALQQRHRHNAPSFDQGDYPLGFSPDLYDL